MQVRVGNAHYTLEKPSLFTLPERARVKRRKAPTIKVVLRLRRGRRRAGLRHPFYVTNDGKEHKLHTFANRGYWPAAGLINVDGTLYGTTAGIYGTLYRFRAGGAENAGSQFVKGASF